MTDPTADAAKLLPCPLCGSSDITIDEIEGIFCRACGAQVVASGNKADVELWNTRPQLA